MPIEMDWIIERRVVFIQMCDTLTADDVDSWDQQAMQFLDAIHNGPVCILVDQTDLKSLRGFNRLVTMRVLRHPRIGEIDLFAIYGVRDRLLIQANKLMVQLSGIPTRFFDTETAAIEAIQQIDPTLPDLKLLLDAHRH